MGSFGFPHPRKSGIMSHHRRYIFNREVKTVSMKSSENEKVFSRLYLVVTKECNLMCKHCYLEAGPGKALDNEITPEEIASIIDAVASDGMLTEVSVTGGEPLARKDIKEILITVLDKGILLNLETNGTLITPEIAELLSQYTNSSVGVSIDGIEDVLAREF